MSFDARRLSVQLPCTPTGTQIVEHVEAARPVEPDRIPPWNMVCHHFPDTDWSYFDPDHAAEVVPADSLPKLRAELERTLNEVGAAETALSKHGK